MNRQLSALIMSFFTAMAVLVAGLQTANAEVEEGTLWRDAVITELDVDFGGTGFHARWRFHRGSGGDLQAQVEQVAPDGVLTGELLMVEGQVLLARGFKEQGVDIEPLIQAPSLMLQLAYSMLNSSQPKGPYAVTKKQTWDKVEKTIDFHLNTGLATGTFAAPWGVKGSGWKTDTDQRRFELLFHFNTSATGEKQESTSITFSGVLDYRQQDFPYPESTDLNGWRLQWISLDDRESEPAAKDLTLKELRQQIKES
jgi:hypothetical protein